MDITRRTALLAPLVAGTAVVLGIKPAKATLGDELEYCPYRPYGNGLPICYSPRPEDWDKIPAEDQGTLARCMALSLRGHGEDDEEKRIAERIHTLNYLSAYLPEFYSLVRRELRSMYDDEVVFVAPRHFVRFDGHGIHDAPPFKHNACEIGMSCSQDIFRVSIAPREPKTREDFEAQARSMLRRRDHRRDIFRTTRQVQKSTKMGVEWLLGGKTDFDYYFHYDHGGQGGSFCLTDPCDKQRCLETLAKLHSQVGDIPEAHKYIDMYHKAIV